MESRLRDWFAPLHLSINYLYHYTNERRTLEFEKDLTRSSRRSLKGVLEEFKAKEEFHRNSRGLQDGV